MVINMLKAISQMLDVNGETATPTAFERVKCAKLMLDEIIQGMIDEKPDTTTVSTSQVTHQEPPKSQLKSPLASELEPKDPEYTMEIDPVTKVLKWMKMDGKLLPPTKQLRIDGKIIDYSKAIGMSFKKLEVVEDAE